MSFTLHTSIDKVIKGINNLPQTEENKTNIYYCKCKHPAYKFI